jgi:single-strand DNA-binding protein
VAATNINRVIITGNLTSDPELRSTGSGLAVCSLRVACNGRRKDNQSGQWVEKPNFFNVTVFGAQGENCARFLSKGRPVAVDGRLDWREYTDGQGNNRQAVEIIAESVQFLGGRDEGQGGGGASQGFTPRTDVPVNTSDFSTPAPAPVAAGNGAPVVDDDIPF